MVKKQKKQNSKVLMEQKRRRRKLLTFWRIIKYGANSFRRNAWLSVAATAVMTVTLVIIFGSLLMRMAITNTVDSLTEKIGVSVYLKQDVSDEDVAKMTKSIESLSSVKKVEYTSASQARDNFAKKKAGEDAYTQALIEASNEFFASFSITLVDIGDTSELKNLVDTDKTIQANLHESKEPTYESSRKDSIETLANAFSVVEKVGLAAAILFVLISSLIIFNTIRMTIFNRREEIYMMKLIGANRGFIRGPFLVEASMYGLIAALVATAAGYGLIFAAKAPLAQYGLPFDSTINLMVDYFGLVLLGMIAIGVFIGVASSYVATRKYLKI